MPPDDTTQSSDQLFTDDESQAEPYPSSQVTERDVFTTAVDPDVRTLLGQIDDRTLVLRPNFQRQSVWTRAQQSKLIESLLLNIPIPPLFFAEDTDGMRVVVDGQQRLLAIDDFRKGEYALTGLQVLNDLNGKLWRDLAPRDIRRIQQRVLRTLVISSHSDADIRFEVFERLNTTGEPLREQEIRNATARGELNNLLDKLARDSNFLSVLGRTEPDPRLAHHEMVLRYFALYAGLANFRPPLKSFLTRFMLANRNPGPTRIDQMEQQFKAALGGAINVFGTNAFRRFRRSDNGDRYESGISKAVYDIQMIAFTEVKDPSLTQKKDEIKAAFEDLSLTNDNFAQALSRATDHRSRFYLRTRLWGEALRGLGLTVPFLTRIPAEQ